MGFDLSELASSTPQSPDKPAAGPGVTIRVRSAGRVQPAETPIGNEPSSPGQDVSVPHSDGGTSADSDVRADSEPRDDEFKC